MQSQSDNEENQIECYWVNIPKEMIEDEVENNSQALQQTLQQSTKLVKFTRVQK